MNRYIIEHKSGQRLVTSASAALDWAEQGYKVWRVVTTERVRADELRLEEIEESLPGGDT